MISLVTSIANSNVICGTARPFQRVQLFKCQNTEGSNALWHMDSFDKLKPYGIKMNGFSHLVVWMEAYITNYWMSREDLCDMSPTCECF